MTAMRPAASTPTRTRDDLDADEAVMHMLADRVPLSLLCDLTAPDGPPSAEILAEEGGPETRWWEQ